MELKEDEALAVTLKGMVRLERLPQFDPDVFINGELTINASFSGKVSDPKIGERAAQGVFNLSDRSSNSHRAGQWTGGIQRRSDDRLGLHCARKRRDAEGPGILKFDHLRPSEWNFTLKAEKSKPYRGAGSL
jgi:hypothetical protein